MYTSHTATVLLLTQASLSVCHDGNKLKKKAVKKYIPVYRVARLDSFQEGVRSAGLSHATKRDWNRFQLQTYGKGPHVDRKDGERPHYFFSFFLSTQRMTTLLSIQVERMTSL